MKNMVPLFIMLMSLNFINAQDRVELSEIKIKSKKVVRYRTYRRNHYGKNKFYYLNGEKYNGIIFENWENGSLKQEFEVNNGIEDGFRKAFYPDGNIEYDYPGNDITKEVGEHNIGFNEDGGVNYVIKVLSIDNNGHSNILHTLYHSNGKILYQYTTKDGKEHGIGYYFYDNGQIQRILPRKHGMPHGTEYFYENTGVLRHQISYEDGERHGMEFYYPKYGGTMITNWRYGNALP